MVQEGTKAAAKTKTEAPQVVKASGADAEANGAPPFSQRNFFPVTIKATLGEDTRLLQASLLVQYNDVYEAIKTKFPTAYPFVLKHADKSGALVTLGSTSDMQKALAELMEQMQKSTEAGAPYRSSLPPLRLKLVKVANESEIPLERPPVMKAQLDDDDMPQEQYEIEGFIVDFARHFTDVTKVDPGVRAEDVALGPDRLTRILDAALSEESAQGLFDKATEHFRDATSYSLVQWGQLFHLRAERMSQALVKGGKAVEGKPLDAILKEYDECDKKLNEALKYRTDSWEAYSTMGQMEMERVKAKLGYIIPTTSETTSEGAPKDTEQLRDEMNAATKVALGKIDAKKVGQVAKQMDVVTKWLEKATALAKAADEKKKAEDAAAEAASAAPKRPELSEEELQKQKLHSSLGNMMVIHGNILYEWSQVLAAVNKPEWKATLDSAVEKFTSAGASAFEIRQALQNHSRKDELDLGPDPAPAAPAAADADTPEDAPVKEAAAKPPAPEAAKGLPSLEVKKKPATKA